MMVDENLLSSVPGFRDFYPEKWNEINYILNTMKTVAKKYGYQEYEGPSLEKVELIEAKSGADLMKEIFQLKDKQERRLLLRPEQTPTLARMLAKEQLRYKRPIRWFSIPRLFRDETVQRGRLREFWQLNVDILGVDSIAADAEVITVAVETVRAAGLQDNQFYVIVNHRELLNSFINSITDIPPHKIIPLIDKKDSFIEKEVEQQLLKLGYDKNKSKDGAYILRRMMKSSGKFLEELKEKATRDVLEIYEKIDDIKHEVMINQYTQLGLELEAAEKLYELTNIRGKPSEFLEKLSKLNITEVKSAFDDLNKLNIYLEGFNTDNVIIFDASLARGLDYYTGIVFEMFDSTGEVVRAICGGGRYSNLVETIGGDPLSGTGFGMGDSVLLELLRLTDNLPSFKEHIDIYLAPIKESAIPSILKLASQLRQFYRIQCNPFNWRVKRHLELADYYNARIVILQGPRDIEKNEISIRIVDSAEQYAIPITDNLVSDIGKFLK